MMTKNDKYYYSYLYKGYSSTEIVLAPSLVLEYIYMAA